METRKGPSMVINSRHKGAEAEATDSGKDCELKDSAELGTDCVTDAPPGWERVLSQSVPEPQCLCHREEICDGRGRPVN